MLIFCFIKIALVSRWIRPIYPSMKIPPLGIYVPKRGVFYLERDFPWLYAAGGPASFPPEFAAAAAAAAARSCLRLIIPSAVPRSKA